MEIAASSRVVRFARLTGLACLFSALVWDRPRVSAQAVTSPSSEADRTASPADALSVFSLADVHRRSEDLGQLLARMPGVSGQRASGLGSDFQLGLAGLYSDQAQVLVDGVPLLQLYAQQVADLPVGLFKRVDVYGGVVPLRLSSEAVGGALDLVHAPSQASGGAASYQVGSFGLHRASLNARYYHAPSGVVAGVETFVDTTENDYDVDVQIPDETGVLSPVRVPRFRDGYRSYGIAAELGLLERSWAETLLVRGFVSGYDKELQSDRVMTTPYGEVHYGARLAGALARYRQTFRRGLQLELLGNYSHRRADFSDQSTWIYDWYGERVAERFTAGELGEFPSDRTTSQHGVFGRAQLEIPLAPDHALLASSAPYYTARGGTERRRPADARDSLAADQMRLHVVSGIQYRVRLGVRPDAAPDLWKRGADDYAWGNAVFVKSYYYRAQAQVLEPYRGLAAAKASFGVGDALRWRPLPWLLAKAGYELTTRAPTLDQLFGDAALITDNTGLKPETSHNANLGARFSWGWPWLGAMFLDGNGVLRDTRDQIILLASDISSSYQNVLHTRTLGVEGALEWSAPGGWVSARAATTYQDQRNRSREGPLSFVEGDRVPSRPWLFASWDCALHLRDLLTARDELQPFYRGRYVHEFAGNWESLGDASSRLLVPRQISHSVGLTYALEARIVRLFASFEVQNLTDAALYDFFAAQRPGRAFYGKLGGAI